MNFLMLPLIAATTVSGAPAFNWVGIVLAVVGIISGLVGVIAYFKGSIGKQTIESLERFNRALKEENAGQASQIAVLTARVNRQEEAIDLVKELVKGTKGLEALNEKLDGYHQAILAALRSK